MDRSGVRKIVEVVISRSAHWFKDKIAILAVYLDADYIANAIASLCIHNQDFFRLWVLIAAAPRQMRPDSFARIVHSHNDALVAPGVCIPGAHSVGNFLRGGKNRKRQQEAVAHKSEQQSERPADGWIRT